MKRRKEGSSEGRNVCVGKETGLSPLLDYKIYISEECQLIPCVILTTQIPYLGIQSPTYFPRV